MKLENKNSREKRVSSTGTSTRNENAFRFFYFFVPVKFSDSLRVRAVIFSSEYAQSVMCKI